jgi:hypothetical protein
MCPVLLSVSWSPSLHPLPSKDSTTIEEKYLELSVDIPPHLQTEVPSMEVLLEAFCQVRDKL